MGFGAFFLRRNNETPINTGFFYPHFFYPQFFAYKRIIANRVFSPRNCRGVDIFFRQNLINIFEKSRKYDTFQKKPCQALFLNFFVSNFAQKKSHQHMGVIVVTTNAPFASLTTLLHGKCQHTKKAPRRMLFLNRTVQICSTFARPC